MCFVSLRNKVLKQFCWDYVAHIRVDNCEKALQINKVINIYIFFVFKMNLKSANGNNMHFDHASRSFTSGSQCTQLKMNSKCTHSHIQPRIQTLAIFIWTTRANFSKRLYKWINCVQTRQNVASTTVESYSLLLY